MRAITKNQIARIWATAHRIGLERDMLYQLVPRGSISAMTSAEANELIGHLQKLAESQLPAADVPAHPDPNAATREQKNFIHFLFGKLGWMEQPRHVAGFLRKYAKVASIEEITDRKRASAVIEALKAIYARNKKEARA